MNSSSTTSTEEKDRPTRWGVSRLAKQSRHRRAYQQSRLRSSCSRGGESQCATLRGPVFVRGMGASAPAEDDALARLKSYEGRYRSASPKPFRFTIVDQERESDQFPPARFWYWRLADRNPIRHFRLGRVEGVSPRFPDRRRWVCSRLCPAWFRVGSAWSRQSSCRPKKLRSLSQHG